ncbi:hypothetical protein [Pseudomonas juntendi]|uniref:Uncharacterized protein n=1 Tax=Pseudomonas juntendi TaxID=2666183 RepID=A0A7W2M021_9PSED|nr:hypothetical protein [Pseudomonas juntendi]MBA6150196.1 hypothetical protein [Pseudomonas juntendi]
MTLTKPNQDLRRDLQGLASDLKWSAVELMRIAVRLSEAGNEHDAQAVIRICQVMQAGEDKLVGYGDEVKAGGIVRAELKPL